MHLPNAEFNSAYESCSFSHREVQPEAVSRHFYIYLGLGIYGGGACLHSLHLRLWCAECGVDTFWLWRVARYEATGILNPGGLVGVTNSARINN